MSLVFKDVVMLDLAVKILFGGLAFGIFFLLATAHVWMVPAEHQPKRHKQQKSDSVVPDNDGEDEK